MKIQNLILFVAVLVSLLSSGCGRSRTITTAHDEHAEEGVTFKEGKGLHIPADTAKFIALKLEDVGERNVSTSISFDAAVYRAAANAQLASVQGGASKISWATATVDSSKATNLAAGQSLLVNSKAGALPGRVSEIKLMGNAERSLHEILIAIEDEKHRLQQGDRVSVTASVGNERTAVVVPKSALLRTAEGAFVYTVNGDYFVRAPIKIRVVQDTFAEVVDGLYAGDQVVTNPVMTLWMAELQSIRGGKACADGH